MGFVPDDLQRRGATEGEPEARLYLGGWFEKRDHPLPEPDGRALPFGGLGVEGDDVGQFTPRDMLHLEGEELTLAAEVHALDLAEHNDGGLAESLLQVPPWGLGAHQWEHECHDHELDEWGAKAHGVSMIEEAPVSSDLPSNRPLPMARERPTFTFPP
ncbi:hypothetical protein D187_010050 [Cystobacter fuscus DSM 2262]|uniref:Uncharacterized protein n=1 Tax=Cystobacter fuscus (strain ATCC 25194 / DSM 2262 / NBRC 100088 / M29) TaxID=1242864 RepID=S9PGH5_CYSF2|nr:hypothetical protein [Cystobacter fuscus]EPX62146.1 hypothetical protein D187_010050 [Cystobacter fuscus DSM 2262]